MNRHGIAVGLLIATLLLVGYAAVGGVLNSEVSSGPDDAAWVGVAFGAVVLAFTTSGYIIASRDGNPLGWLLLGIGTIEALGAAASAYAVYALLNRPSSLPGEMAAWTADFIIGGLGIVFGSLIFVFLLFPDGRLPGRWWRTVAGVGFGGIVLAQVQVALNPGRLAGFPAVDNPLGVRGLEDAIAVMQSVAFGALTLSLLAAAVSLVIRFRRSRGIERQQLKWFTTASAFLALAIVSGPIWWGLFPGVGNVVWPVLFASSLSAIPIAMGIAILKYRLYDIDVVINKTLVFGALAAFITGIYVAVVVGIGELLGSAEEPNLALSIAATAIVAIAFQPVKDRVEGVANRLVYGVRRTPYEVLADFSDKVATSYETREVTPAMARTLAEATGAARAEVWLALDSTLVLSASSGEGGGNGARSGAEVMALDGADIEAIEGVDAVVAVTHQQELLGALAIAKDRAEPVTSADRRLLSDLAAQAGIVLRNARLTAELQARLDEISVRAEQIRESRRRIVAAQDQARRRLERDIHDGAQQHLVALAVKLNLAKTITERKPERAGAMLDQLEVEMGDALLTLGDLARGIYPPLLRDKGIAAALQARGASAPFELTVVDRTRARSDEATEAAIYFCCLEALQNVAKYARANNVVVELDDLDGLSFRVTDDGAGFEVDAVRDGSGLQGMADRLAAVGGAIEVDSIPGKGTTVVGRVGVREASRA